MEEASGNGVEERQDVEAKQEDEIIDIATDTWGECEVADTQAKAAENVATIAAAVDSSSLNDLEEANERPGEEGEQGAVEFVTRVRAGLVENREDIAFAWKTAKRDAEKEAIRADKCKRAKYWFSFAAMLMLPAAFFSAVLHFVATLGNVRLHFITHGLTALAAFCAIFLLGRYGGTNTPNAQVRIALLSMPHIIMFMDWLRPLTGSACAPTPAWLPPL